MKVVSVGGFGGFIREYKKEISARGLSDYFLFLGFFNNISPILGMVDALVIPSLSEACPLVPMEALVSGCPVIAYSCIGLREVLDKSPAIMGPAGDRIELAKNIIKIKDNYEDIKERFEDYIPEARKRYDAAMTAKQLEILFNSFLQR